jgi:alpha-glucoside transport system substrate-binding protein
MVRPFEELTGTRVQFEGTRDINAVLTTRVRGGNPPDLAVLPTPGQIGALAREGRLVPLDPVLDMPAMGRQYGESWMSSATVGGKLYGIVVKAALKGLVWYDPPALRAVPASFPGTWDALLALTDRLASVGKTPWCIGLESGAASGWPATDWIEILMLRSAQAGLFDQWIRHEIPWTHPAVKRAWSLFGRIAANPRNVRGGIQGELAINFGEAPFPLFTSPPGCYFHLQAAFIEDFIQKQYPALKPDIDFSFEPFPVIDRAIPEAVEVAGDVMVMFRRTPATAALIRYLTTAEAQAIWAKRGGALSLNRGVSLSTYPDSLSRKAAAALTAAPIVRFDASDMMPQPVNSAFLEATLEYLQHPDHLDQILRELDRVATESASP